MPDKKTKLSFPSWNFITGIAGKTLLLSMSLLIVPFIGYLYLSALDEHLRDTQKRTLMSYACTAANFLAGRQELFRRELFQTLSEKVPFKADSLKKVIQLDGNLEDWDAYRKEIKQYGSEHTVKGEGGSSLRPYHFRHYMGKYKGYLYVFFDVLDDSVKLLTEQDEQVHLADHIQIIIQDPLSKEYKRYVISTGNDGWVSAAQIPLSDEALEKNYQAIAEGRIGGIWTTTDKGYALEFRLPLNLIGQHLVFAVADVDKISGTLKTLTGTSGVRLNKADSTWKILDAAEEIKLIARLIEKPEGRKAYVIDLFGREFARDGSLSVALPQNIPLLMHVHRWQSPGDSLPASPPLKNPEARAKLLQKKEFEYQYWSVAENSEISVASCPIQSKDTLEFMGYVVVEESGKRILALQPKVLDDLLEQMSAIIFIVLILMIYFGVRLRLRIRRLQRQTEAAMGINGQILPEQIKFGGKDELAALGSSFFRILNELKEYNLYLQSVSGKLSHELRTPLTVMRSSLENLEMESPPEMQQSVYLERAKSGISRLFNLIARLSEATRLEQAMQTMELERFDLCEMVETCCEGYAMAYPQQQFKAYVPKQKLPIMGEPDLIVQMLDKLVSNAVDFSRPDTPINIKVQEHNGYALLHVINQGRPLPKEMQERLFESMVSMRGEAGHNPEPHLGLGLYIARLIINYHHGTIHAANTSDGKGVMMTARLPLAT